MSSVFHRSTWHLRAWHPFWAAASPKCFALQHFKLLMWIKQTSQNLFPWVPGVGNSLKLLWKYPLPHLAHPSVCSCTGWCSTFHKWAGTSSEKYASAGETNVPNFFNLAIQTVKNQTGGKRGSPLSCTDPSIHISAPHADFILFG